MLDHSAITQSHRMFRSSFLTLFIVLFSISPLLARKGPQHKSIRALGMGNAFVAVAEDRDAIYYNPAGLNLMGKLGDYKENPELGYYPDNWLDMRLSVVTSLILPDMWGIGVDAFTFYDNHKKTFGKFEDDVVQALSEDRDFYKDAIFIDGLALSVGVRPMHGEIAFHNFGAALWSEAHAYPVLEMGIITPSVVLERVDAVAVGQLAFAFGLPADISVGFGYRMVETAHLGRHEINIVDGLDPDPLIEQLSDELDSLIEEVSGLNMDHALDFGLMWQMSREVRLGAAVQNVFIGDYEGESVTPHVTIGAAFSPRKLQRNTAFARKVNFAADFEDLLNNERNYKFFSHLNLGVEVEQVFLAYPSLKTGSNARALLGRLAAGFKGGYWTLGIGGEILRVVHIDAVTWAEEAGYYTGQRPERYYMVEIGFGI